MIRRALRALLALQFGAESVYPKLARESVEGRLAEELS